MSAQPAMTTRGLVVETVEAPDGPRAPERVQPRLETVVHVVEGVVYLVAGDDETVLTPGDSATIPAGVPFRRWNAGDDDARFVETFRVTAAEDTVLELSPEAEVASA
jgi:quercetin dioxygenase-like cupin family protein